MANISVDVVVNTNKIHHKQHFDDLYIATDYLFSTLTDEQRMQIIGSYCKYCGCDNPRCNCENDD